MSLRYRREEAARRKAWLAEHVIARHDVAPCHLGSGKTALALIGISAAALAVIAGGTVAVAALFAGTFLIG